VRGTAVRQVLLGAGTAWETPLFVVAAEREGPTLLVVAGIHGDESAGPQAARELARAHISHGRLVVIPEANRAAIAARRRMTPFGRHRDVNRNFPTGRRAAPRGELAALLWRAVTEAKPSVLVDLHEGFDFRSRNTGSVGNSVIWQGAQARLQAQRLRDAANARISDPARRFVLLRHPIRGSLARAAADELGVPALVIETTKNHQPLATRVAEMRRMLARLLADLGMRRR
jgi:predicted deacylase